MSEEVVRREDSPIGEIALPGIATIVDLEDGEACAQALDDLRDFEQLISEAKAALTRAVVAHSERIGLLTFELPDGRKAEVVKRPVVTYDAEAIEEGLRAAGMSEERIRDIVKEEVTYKVAAVEAKKAARSNENYAQIIEDARSEIPKTPSVTIRRR